MKDCLENIQENILKFAKINTKSPLRPSNAQVSAVIHQKFPIKPHQQGNNGSSANARIASSLAAHALSYFVYLSV